MSLRRGLAEPLCGSGGILGHALAVHIHLAQLVLRLGIAALSLLQRSGRGGHARACNRQRAILQTAEFKLGARCGGSGIAQKIHATFRTGLRGCALGKGRQTRHDQRCDGSELHSGTIPRRLLLHQTYDDTNLRA
jgi:hypothetical protein